MERLTITVPDDVAERARALAGDRGLSGYVTGALEARLGRDESLAALRAYTGVVPTEDEDAHAAELFGDVHQPAAAAQQPVQRAS